MLGIVFKLGKNKWLNIRLTPHLLLRSLISLTLAWELVNMRTCMVMRELAMGLILHLLPGIGLLTSKPGCPLPLLNLLPHQGSACLLLYPLLQGLLPVTCPLTPIPCPQTPTLPLLQRKQPRKPPPVDWRENQHKVKNAEQFRDKPKRIRSTTPLEPGPSTLPSPSPQPPSLHCFQPHLHHPWQKGSGLQAVLWHKPDG